MNTCKKLVLSVGCYDVAAAAKQSYSRGVFPVPVRSKMEIPESKKPIIPDRGSQSFLFKARSEKGTQLRDFKSIFIFSR